MDVDTIIYNSMQITNKRMYQVIIHAEHVVHSAWILFWLWMYVCMYVC